MTDTDNLWFPTASGQRVHLTNPNPDTIKIADIAQNLAGQCRFFGATTRHCSIAEHTVRISWIIHARNNVTMDRKRLYGILRKWQLHDAHEYVLGDMVRPLKILLPQYNVLATGVQEIIERRYKITKIKEEDQKMLNDLDICWPLVEGFYAKLHPSPSALPKLNNESDGGHKLAELAFETSNGHNQNWGWDRNFARTMFLNVCRDIGLKDPE